MSLGEFSRKDENSISESDPVTEDRFLHFLEYLVKIFMATNHKLIEILWQKKALPVPGGIQTDVMFEDCLQMFFFPLRILFSRNLQ